MELTTYELTDGTAVIRMDDGKANALGHAMIDSLGAALDRAEREAKAVVLTGRVGRFCAGFDLRTMMTGVDAARALVAHGGELLLRLYGLPLPLVVACGGHALAGGALVVLTGDLRVGARGAYRIGLNEVQIGMPVPILAMELARDRLEPRELTAATLFAKVVDPDEAARIGWLDELADEAALLPRALAHASRLATLARDAFAKTKQSLRGRTIRYVRDTLVEDMARLTPPVGP
ncbi:MAG: crotonase/enoyl-CoA hydratase family protein [Polyangiaceae bacterium]|nr:crotonase/enoyl-CoA hydratase family protein [Polyangiaceae bacterium]